jgi:hypothetical protein
MTHLRIALAAALLSAASFPALAADNPATANTQTAMSTSSSISSEASSTQRKGMHLKASQRSKADAAEAETTRQLNQQAAAQAAPSGMPAK